jgi:outer membrane murein-binding lipoprotein Lpp
VDQKAAGALSSAKGTVNDSAETITIYGARKYADAINTSLTTKINSVGSSLSALDLLVDGISKDLKQTDSTATQAKEAADKANQDLAGVKTTAEGAAANAAQALSTANTAQ